MSTPRRGTANPDHQQKLSKEEKAEKKRADADLKYLASLPQFRRHNWRVVMGVCNAMGLSYVGRGEADTANREGKRAVGIELIAQFQRVAPEQWALTLTEVMREVAEAKLKRKQAEKQDSAETTENE